MTTNLFVRSILITLCIVCCGIFNSHAQSLAPESQASKDILYYHVSREDGWVPFRVGAETGRKGVLEEVSDLLQAYSNIEFAPVIFPTKRAEKALKDGVVDFDFVCLEWLKDSELRSKYVVTEPLFEVVESFATLTHNAHLIPSPDSAYNQAIGTIGGYFYHDDNRFTRVDFLNEDQLIRGLKQDRFNAIILEKETAKYWANIHDVDIAFPAVHSKGKLLLRLRKEHKALVPRVNQAILKIKASGELQKILNKHNVESLIL